MERCCALEVPGGHPVIRKPTPVPKGRRVAVRLTSYRSPACLFLRYELSGVPDTNGFHMSRSNKPIKDAFIGMYCLICQDSSTKLALRALVTDVHRNPSGKPMKVRVEYVDSGRADAVDFNCLYTINAEAAAKAQEAIPCCIRNVNPTDASCRFDLKHLWKQGPRFEAVFHSQSDAGVYEVDLYAICCDEQGTVKTFDVGEFLVQNGFAKLVRKESESSAQGVASVSCGIQKGSTGLPSVSLAPRRFQPKGDNLLRGAESPAMPVKKRMEILVTFVNSPDHFYGQDVSKDERSLVQLLLLQSWVKVFDVTEVKIGYFYVYRERPEQPGARARVEDVLSSGDCRVWLTDHGQRKTVNISSLFMAHPRLFVIPPLAMRLQLYGIQPQREWTEAAVKHFVTLTHTGTPLTAVLVETRCGSEIIRIVQLFNPAGGDVAECMTRAGYAMASRDRRSVQ